MQGKIKIEPADTIFSKAIRTRDEWKCIRCGRAFANPNGMPFEKDIRRLLDCSHFYSRDYRNTRFDPDNCISLCKYKCHRYFHKNPREHVEFYKERLGERRFDLLTIRANTYKKKDKQMEYLKAQEYFKQIKAEKGIE